jgi:hypothetical protein
LQAVSSGLHCQDIHGRLAKQALDAPIVALGEKLPIAYSPKQTDVSQGMHFNQFNNAWGTNYIQWFGEDACYRLTLRA